MYVCRDAQLEERTARILIRLGFPTDLKGYEYLRCAIIESYYSPELANYVTKSLFVRVARLCGHVSVPSVSRGCRHAIEHACDFGTLKSFLDYSSVNKYPPSSLVIGKIARHLHSFEQKQI